MIGTISKRPDIVRYGLTARQIVFVLEQWSIGVSVSEISRTLDVGREVIYYHLTAERKTACQTWGCL